MSPRRYAAIALAVLAAGTARSAAKRFECMGIGGGGQMYAVGISPHDPKIMHLSCDMGNFYLTEDGGKSWHMVDQLQMNGIRSCRPAYHPTDPDTVYAPYTRGTSQLRVSHDRGWTWEVVCEDAPWGKAKGRDKYDEFITSIEIGPGEPDLVFASTPAGLFRSTDGGRSFSKCPGVEGMAITVHASPAGACVAGSAKGVYVSRDGGVRWSKTGSGLPSEDMWSFSAETDPASKKITCYALYRNAIYRSLEGGENFTKVGGLLETRWRHVVACPVAPNVAYASNFDGKFGVWKTTDAGATWKRVFWAGHPGIRWGWLGTDYTRGFGGRANCITVGPCDPNLLAYVNTGELFVTRDGGTTWREGCSDYAGPDPDRIEKGKPWAGIGLEVALPTDMIWDPWIEDRVYLLYGDITFLVSTDRGRSWRRSVKGIPKPWANRMYRILADPMHRGRLYAACAGHHHAPSDTSQIRLGGGVVVTDDHGETWRVASAGLPPHKIPCTDLAIDLDSPPESRRLYCVMQNDGVYRSDDGAGTWVKKSAGIGRGDNRNVTQVCLDVDGNVYALVIGKSKGWDFGKESGGLFKSIDHGETWSEITKSVDLCNPRYFAVDSRDTNHIFVATTQAPRREGAGLWRTTDGGKTWKRALTRDMMGKHLYNYVHSGDISFHPTDPGIVYYSTKTHGTWFSHDRGVTWKRILGIPRIGTGRIITDPVDPRFIYVCSVGLWKGPADGLDGSTVVMPAKKRQQLTGTAVAASETPEPTGGAESPLASVAEATAAAATTPRHPKPPARPAATRTPPREQPESNTAILLGIGVVFVVGAVFAGVRMVGGTRRPARNGAGRRGRGGRDAR